MTQENKKEEFTVSSLTEYVGIGDRKTWRKIVANEKYSKKFKVRVANKTRVYVRTLLSKLQLIGIYNDYFENYIRPKQQLSIMKNVHLPKKLIEKG